MDYILFDLTCRLLDLLTIVEVGNYEIELFSEIKLKCRDTKVDYLTCHLIVNYTNDYFVCLSCEDGYILNGSDRANCTNSGEWDPRLPECLMNSTLDTAGSEYKTNLYN